MSLSFDIMQLPQRLDSVGSGFSKDFRVMNPMISSASAIEGLLRLAKPSQEKARVERLSKVEHPDLREFNGLRFDDFLMQLDEVVVESCDKNGKRDRYERLLADESLHASWSSIAIELHHEFMRPYRPAKPGMTLHEWYTSDDVGSSSLFMMSILRPDVRAYAECINYAEPSDLADFIRCDQALDALDGARIDLYKMKDHGEVWRLLVDSWAEIKRLVENDEDDKAYALLMTCTKKDNIA